MIQSPRTDVTVSMADSFSVSEPSESASRRAVESWFKHQTFSEAFPFKSLAELPVQLKIDSIPPRHSGFGTGTQLALCSAMAVTQFLDLTMPGPMEMAASVGRGARSGIGSHGFYHGGFLVDRGKPTEVLDEGATAPLAPLDFQTEFPTQWPIVTIMLKDENGLSGSMEIDAFKNLPATPASTRDQMIDLVRNQMIPGVTQSNYDLFADGLFEYGRRSGMMFAPIQNGPYNGQSIEKLVNQIHEFGVHAVGQSSWGPCVFAITRDDKTASDLVSFVTSQYPNRCETNITCADNSGAQMLTSKPG